MLQEIKKKAMLQNRIYNRDKFGIVKCTVIDYFWNWSKKTDLKDKKRGETREHG